MILTVDISSWTTITSVTQCNLQYMYNWSIIVSGTLERVIMLCCYISVCIQSSYCTYLYTALKSHMVESYDHCSHAASEMYVTPCVQCITEIVFDRLYMLHTTARCNWDLFAVFQRDNLTCLSSIFDQKVKAKIKAKVKGSDVYTWYYSMQEHCFMLPWQPKGKRTHVIL